MDLMNSRNNPDLKNNSTIEFKNFRIDLKNLKYSRINLKNSKKSRIDLKN